MYACQNCTGSGKVISKWFSSLGALPVQRLRFDYDSRHASILRRQQEIRGIQSEIARLSRELDDMYRWWEQQQRENSYFTKIEGGYPAGLDGLPRAISRLESEASDLASQIREAEDEMSAIEEVLKSKLAA